MQRTTILLPPTLKAKAHRVAKEMGISLGELIRSSIELRCSQKIATLDPFFADSHIHQGKTPDDIAKNHDDYLY